VLAQIGVVGHRRRAFWRATRRRGSGLTASTSYWALSYHSFGDERNPCVRIANYRKMTAGVPS
jgi:hypothetical protein